MPIYEYICSKCLNELEVFHGVANRQKRTCPECGGRLKKIISSNAFHLKGGGWYKDGYSGSNNKSNSKQDSKSTPVS